MQIEPFALTLSPGEMEFSYDLGEVSRAALGDVMDAMRSQGVSEQELASFMTAMRMRCITELWEVDLENMIIGLLEMGHRAVSLREVFALTLMPELAGAMR